MKMTKTHSQRVHAKRRCLERYGESINRDDIQAIIRLIQSGDTRKAKLLERQSIRVSTWRVTFRDKDMRVVYDRTRKTIVSFLPLEERPFPIEQEEA